MAERRQREADSLRQLFHEQWQYVLSLPSTLSQKRRQQRLLKQQVDDTVELIVNGTDSKVRIISDYHEQLRQCARHQISYVNQLSAHLARVNKAGGSRFSQNQLLQAIFMNYTNFQEYLGNHFPLQEFIHQQHLQPDDRVYALLQVHKDQKTVFMPGLMDDKVVQEVRQTKISFGRRHLSNFAVTRPELFSQLKQELHNTIVQQLKLKLDPLLAERAGTEVIADINDPASYLGQLKLLMDQPEKIVYLQGQQMMTNRFGILADETHAIEAERSFSFKELFVETKDAYLLLPISVPVHRIT